MKRLRFALSVAVLFSGTSFATIGLAFAQSPNSISAETSCHSDDPSHLCIGMKYVAYLDSHGQTRVTSAVAQENIKNINAVWKQCNIAFEIDKYVPVRPADYGLQYQTTDYSDLTDIRHAFAEDTTLLLVNTGPWNRSGSLGNSSANAWTSMPGSGPYGAVFEKPVETNANLIAHEIGHYLNLDHASNVKELMNAIIYSHSIEISRTDCQMARNTAQTIWQKMLR